MKVGLLYPSSNAHPSIGIQFFDGLKKCLQLKALTETISLVPEGIGFGAVEKEVYQKAEKLLVVDGVDVLVTYVDIKTVTIIEPLLAASGKLMIVVNAGANCPQNWHAKHNVIFLTLQHSFLCWLNGFKAAQAANKNGLLATTFYDCGYAHSSVMVESFASSGGNITYNYINNQAYDNNFNINELITFLSETENDTNNLLCVFDSKPTELFYRQLKASLPRNDLHLFVSPMMLEDGALTDLQKTFPFSIEGFVPWHISLKNESNEEFNKCCSQQTKAITNIFTLQGWETGLVLQQLLINTEKGMHDGTLIKGLLNQPINSPRGDLKLDAKTNFFIAPIVHCYIPANTTQPVITTITDYENNWNTFIAIIPDNVSSGWFNTYLCY